MNEDPPTETQPPDHFDAEFVVPDAVTRLDLVCRVCGTESEKGVAIFGADGAGHELALKMNAYLPFKVSEADRLPLRCCWGCASAILAWHDLVVTSIETERRLRELDAVASGETIVSGGSGGAKDEVEEILPHITTHEVASVSLSACYEPNIDHETELPISETLSFVVDKENPKMLEKKPIESQVAELEETEQSTTTKPNNKTTVEYTFKCDYCSSVFAKEKEIVKHIREYHGDQLEEDSGENNLPREKKKEKRKHTKIDQDAVNEAKVVIDGKIYYNCKECGKSLYSPYTYLWHVRIHTGERPYVCDLCGKQFRVSQGLARHLRETHQGIKKFGCDICGRMFSCRRNVDEHRNTHTNERPYVCDLCGKRFKQKASLFVHNRSHSDHFPYRCAYCDMPFRSRPPLLLHVTRHTGERPYSCEECGRCFRVKYEMKRHMLVHSDAKPFACEACGLCFRQKRYLRNHVKTNHEHTAGGQCD